MRRLSKSYHAYLSTLPYLNKNMKVNIFTRQNIEQIKSYYLDTFNIKVNVDYITENNYKITLCK